MNEHETVINYQISVNSPKTGHNSLKTGLVCNCYVFKELIDKVSINLTCACIFLKNQSAKK